MTTAETPAPTELVTYEDFSHRIPLSRRQFESLGAVPSVRLTPKGKTYYNRSEVDRWILATLAPLAGGAE